MDSVESTHQTSEYVSHDPSLQDAAAHDSARLGDALIAHTKLKQQDIDRILAFQADKNILFGEAAIQLGLITKKDLQKALSEQFNYSYLHDGNQKLSQSLVAAHQPFSLEVEHLRSLRSQLLIRWFDQGNKTLAVVSVSKQEGASEFVANLAIIFSQLNKKTLLIDANLRQSTQHKLFNIETKVGLANILANRQGLYQLTRQQSLPNLAILTAGTEVPNPQELLSQSALAELLVDLEKIYEIILIDTSPLELGSDVLTVVSKVKAAVILTRKDVTAVTDLQLLHQQLNMAGAQIVGSVIQDY
jgi:chain length determinant protein tyrosine kinase EpsG